MTIEEEAQEQLVVLKPNQIGEAADLGGRDALMCQCRGRNTDLVAARLQGLGPRRPCRSLFVQAGTGQPRQIGVRILLERRGESRPGQNVSLALVLAFESNIGPALDLPPARIPGPDQAIPRLLGLGAQTVFEDRRSVRLEISHRDALGPNIP